MGGALKAWQIRLINLAWILIGLVLVIEFIIDVQRAGDFQGYINSGQLVLDGKDIYSDYLNTWPPFFSVFSVPLTLLHNLNPLLVRILWLAGSLLAMWYVVVLSVEMLSQKSPGWKTRGHKISIRELLITIPVLLILKYVMDNMANLQINMYLLLVCVAAFHQFSVGRNWQAGLLIALGISLKIYPLFLLIYFLYKREFKLVSWTLLFVMILNSVSFTVFGWEEALDYYLRWQKEVTPRSFMANHKNQSYFGVMLRLFTNMDPDHGLYTNVLSLDPAMIKRLTYLLLGLIGLIPAFVFRKKISDNSKLATLLEVSFVFSAIPLLSPIAWKAYFIFLWPAIFMSYTLLFRTKTDLSQTGLRRLRIAFWISILLVIGSAEIFVGPHLSDVLESYSVIAIGNTILLIIMLVLAKNQSHFDPLVIKLNYTQSTSK